MKLGIVGNGGIVKGALRSLQSTDIPVMELWCRNREKGEALQRDYEIPKYENDYDVFLRDDSYDTVYIGLVNSLHYSYAKKALQAGKNVIVEKPFTSTYREARDLFDTAMENHVSLFEGIMSRYADNYECIIQHLDEIGDPKIIYSNFSQYSRRYDAYLDGNVLPAFDPALSGGALYDINVYNVSLLTGIFGVPKLSYYLANRGFNGVDTSGVLIMDYGDFKAVCQGAKDSISKNGTVIQGTKGYIEVKGRPSIVDQVMLHINEDNEDRDIGTGVEEDPLRKELVRIGQAVDEKDDTLVLKWLNQSLQTMYVLENARLDAGIEFPADKE